MKKQIVTYHEHWGLQNDTCSCGKCGKTIGLRDAQLDGATGLAWFDPYNRNMYYHSSSKGCYVHFECLSDKRKQEIAKQEQGQ